MSSVPGSPSPTGDTVSPDPGRHHLFEPISIPGRAICIECSDLDSGLLVDWPCDIKQAAEIYDNLLRVIADEIRITARPTKADREYATAILEALHAAGYGLVRLPTTATDFLHLLDRPRFERLA